MPPYYHQVPRLLIKKGTTVLPPAPPHRTPQSRTSLNRDQVGAPPRWALDALNPQDFEPAIFFHYTGLKKNAPDKREERGGKKERVSPDSFSYGMSRSGGSGAGWRQTHLDCMGCYIPGEACSGVAKGKEKGKEETLMV